jgi:hypothetical protein
MYHRQLIPLKQRQHAGTSETRKDWQAKATANPGGRGDCSGVQRMGTTNALQDDSVPAKTNVGDRRRCLLTTHTKHVTSRGPCNNTNARRTRDAFSRPQEAARLRSMKRRPTRTNESTRRQQQMQKKNTASKQQPAIPTDSKQQREAHKITTTIDRYWPRARPVQIPTKGPRQCPRLRSIGNMSLHTLCSMDEG